MLIRQVYGDGEGLRSSQEAGLWAGTCVPSTRAKHEGLSSSQEKQGGSPGSFSPSCFVAVWSPVTAVWYQSWLEHRQPDPGCCAWALTHPQEGNQLFAQSSCRRQTAKGLGRFWETCHDLIFLCVDVLILSETEFSVLGQ